MHLSPQELRTLTADVPLDAIEPRPREGITREGISFAMGHELVARFDGVEVIVTIDPTRNAEQHTIHWSFPGSVPPIGLVAQRRIAGMPPERGLKTGVRAFDAAFVVRCDLPDVAARVLDPVLAEQLATNEVCVLHDIIAIADEQTGVPGFGTFFRVPPRPAVVAESFEITRALQRRIFAS